MKSSTPMVLVVILMTLLVWLGTALVRVENERHALEVGLCSVSPTDPLTTFECLKKAETRTGWWWHLFYALKD